MRYKVGDKVKIKTWKEMQKKYGLNGDVIECGFVIGMEKQLNEKFPDRILEIETVNKCNYSMKNFKYYVWNDKMIKCLAKGYKEPEQITSRFDILDFRE